MVGVAEEEEEAINIVPSNLVPAATILDIAEILASVMSALK